MCLFFFLILFFVNCKEGKLILVTCSPHISHFTVIFPIAEELSKRLGPNDKLYFGGSMKFKDHIDKFPGVEFYDLYKDLISNKKDHWEQHIYDNRESRWKDNVELWKGVSRIVDDLNIVIISTYPEFETVERRLLDFEQEIGKPDLILVDPIAAGGKTHAKREGIPHVTISPNLQSPHPYEFGFPGMSILLKMTSLTFLIGYFGVTTVDEMTFFRCLKENIWWMLIFVYRSISLLLDQGGLYQAYMDKKSNPMIIATVIGFDYATKDTLSHFMKYVGFIPHRRIEPPLSDELLRFLDENPNTVYVSSGTSVLWPDGAVEGIYRTLEKYNVSVIASVNSKARIFFDPEKKYFEESSYTNNIRFEEWMNQYLLLKHPSIKIFISHGGSGGLAETIDNLTPVMVLPVGSDQFANSARVKERGIGEGVGLVEEFKNGVFEEKFLRMWRNVTQEGEESGYYRKNLRRIKKVSELHGGVRAAADFLEEVLVMGGYDHLRNYKNPHLWVMRPILCVIGLVLLILICCIAFKCYRSSQRCDNRKKKAE